MGTLSELLVGGGQTARPTIQHVLTSAQNLSFNSDGNLRLWLFGAGGAGLFSSTTPSAGYRLISGAGGAWGVVDIPYLAGTPISVATGAAGSAATNQAPTAGGATSVTVGSRVVTAGGGAPGALFPNGVAVQPDRAICTGLDLSFLGQVCAVGNLTGSSVNYLADPILYSADFPVTELNPLGVAGFHRVSSADQAWNEKRNYFNPTTVPGYGLVGALYLAGGSASSVGQSSGSAPPAGRGAVFLEFTKA